jgi:hypothetical protein
MSYQSAIIFSDSNRGVYIPKYWAESADLNAFDNWNEDQIAILKFGPEHEFYCETWNEILDNVETNDGGKLHQDQDGGLWIIYAQAAIDAVNEYCAQEVEYEESHEDAGNNYSHMPGESWCSDMQSRLMEQIADFDLCGLEPDRIADLALENFRMYKGTIYGISGNLPDSDFAILESYHIQEIEIDLSGLGIDDVTMDYIRESCDAYMTGTDRAYATSSAVWYAAIKKTKLQKLIKDSVNV